MNSNCVKEVDPELEAALSQSFTGLSESRSFSYVLEQLASGSPNPKERRRLVRELRDAIKACAAAQCKRSAEELSGQAWIKTDDRLPEPYEEVRILFNGVPRIARLNHGRGYFQLSTFSDSVKGQYIASFDNVEGWMPLPTGPAAADAVVPA